MRNPRTTSTTAATRLLTESYSRVDQTGSYSRPILLELPTSTNHTTASQLLTESYSRCNRTGATPDRL